MSLKSLERKIESCRQEIGGLETQIAEKKMFLLGLQEAAKFYPKDGSDSNKGETALRHGSDVALVRDFLLEHGKPAHITEILTGIGKDNSRSNRTSISGSLSNYARRNDIFTRTAPNTFALISLRNTDTGDMEQSVPPDNFGLDFEENDSATLQ